MIGQRTGGPGSSGAGVAGAPGSGDGRSGSDDERLRARVAGAIGERYELEAEIGRGGMAVVYRARDVRLRRRVALKVLPPELAFRTEVRQRFLREAQTAAQLSHPSIVPIFSVDEGEGLVWFAMGLVQGESLAARLHREPRPPVDFVRRVLHDVADALDYAHARGVIHRDVKPDNILIDRDSGRAMVTDFGIARAAEAGTRLTATGIAVGTPTYMSPEQAMGEREVDARSDIYSLGVVAYQMIAGEVPFQAISTPAMLMKHITERPRPLSEVRSGIPAPLSVAVERALEKEPEDRWDSARAMREAIDGAQPPRRGMLPWGGSRSATLPGAASGSPVPPLPDAAGAARASSQRNAAPAASDGAGGADRRPSDEVVRLPADTRGGSSPSDLPPYPAFPISTNREARELWRQQQAEWQRTVQRRLAHDRGLAKSESKKDRKMARFSARPLEDRLKIFRRKAVGALGTIGFLGFINLVTVPFFPWVIFPAWGILGGLSPYWSELREEGVTMRDVWRGRLRSGAEPKRITRSEARRMERERNSALWWDRLPDLERRVKSLQRWLGGAFLLPAIGLLFGAMAGEEAFLVMGLMGGWGSAMVAAVKAVRLRRIGVRMRQVLRPGWRERLRALDPRSSEARLDAEARALVEPDVLEGAQGQVVRQALHERQQVRRAIYAMAEEERALVPDVLPTADALVERVGALAQALHRLEHEMPHEMARGLDARFAALENSPPGADTERRRTLLERQRLTLRDLEDRRVQVGGQLDSALLVLQQMKLDLLRLRSAGFQSALGAVTSATQEARALSRDIGHVLDAGTEIDEELERRQREGRPVDDHA